MAIRWNWDEKCGEAIFKDLETGKEFTKTLYVGNAFLIFLTEWNEDGKDMYALYTFFADEEHAKNCLGLNKKNNYGDNMFENGITELVKLRINKQKCRYWKKIVTLFTQAFDAIQIELFKEEN